MFFYFQVYDLEPTELSEAVNYTFINSEDISIDFSSSDEIKGLTEEEYIKIFFTGKTPTDYEVWQHDKLFHFGTSIIN